MKLYASCDYFKDDRDSEFAPGGNCEDCYRWSICAHAYFVGKRFIPITKMSDFIGKQVWIHTPGVEMFGRVTTIENVDTENKIVWLVNDFTCHMYGTLWVAYPFEDVIPREYEEVSKDGNNGGETSPGAVPTGDNEA